SQRLNRYWLAHDASLPDTWRSVAMGDLELAAMLQRATADPHNEFVDRMLALQSVDVAPGADQQRRAQSYISPPSRRRSSRRLALAGAAAVLVVVAGAVFVARAGEKNQVGPADGADRLSVEVDGEPVPTSDLDAATERVQVRVDELGLGPYEVQVEAASGALATRFFADLGRSEGGPISEADIDEAVDGAESIERLGRVLTPDEIKADPELRAEVAAGLSATRGIGVLTLQLGSPGEGPEAEARWRAWFTEQLREHSVVVEVDDTEIDYAMLVNAALFLGPA
ncbi:MAG: hypothetical protein ACYC2O_12085, partial [Microthrixaceae bacterium]